VGRLTVNLAPIRGRALAAIVAIAVCTLVPPSQAAPVPSIRAAYTYDHQDPAQVDALGSASFNRVVIRLIGDSLGAGGGAALTNWIRGAGEHGLDPVPDFLLQSKKALSTRPISRRYTWGAGSSDPDVACPLDSVYWRAALLDRAEEILTAAPSTRRIAVDLEFMGGPPKHYDAGPCRCSECLAEYTGSRDAASAGDISWRLTGLLSYEEARLTSIVSALLGEFAARHPGVELGIFDLDLDSFAHRALARAMARAGIPVADYCERSYSVGGGPLIGARARLDALGLSRASLVGGLWLKRFKPRDVPAGLRSIVDHADGYFIFTTFSLARAPSSLTGPYTLLGAPAEYWQAFTQVNVQQ
jgi:hypothetical protein